MKKFHTHFITHLRSYRSFHFLFFTFLLLIISIIIYIFGSNIYAAQMDLLEQAFQPAIDSQTIINLGAGKNAVGNEVFSQGVGIQDRLGRGCFVNSQLITDRDLQTEMTSVGYVGTVNDFCTIKNGTYNVSAITTEAPLIVRITKFLLRITMVLAITMVIFNGIMWIIESSKGAEVKDAKKNITLIVVGIIIALLSLSIINLISSLTISSLG